MILWLFWSEALIERHALGLAMFASAYPSAIAHSLTTQAAATFPRSRFAGLALILTTHLIETKTRVIARTAIVALPCIAGDRASGCT
jgi:hypothetical protein